MNKKKLSFLAIAIAIAVIISLIPPMEGLTGVSMRFMGIFIAGLFLLVSNAMEAWQVFMLIAAACVLTKVTSFGTMASQFAGSTVWLLMVLFALGAAMAKSGLLVRIVYKLLTLFPANYHGAVLALMTSSAVVCPLIPSAQAKSNILIPLVNQLTETLGIKDRSRGAMGLFSIVMIICLVGSTAFVTGGSMVPTLIGMMGADGERFDMISYFAANSVWFFTLLIGTYIFSAKICKPKEETREFSKDYFAEKGKELGPMTYEEKVVLIVFVSLIVLWATTMLTNLNTTMVGFVGILCLMVFGVVDTKDFTKSVPWTTLIFIGYLLCMTTLMQETGWNDWMAGNLAGVVGLVLGNPYTFVLFLCILVAVMRLFVLDGMATLVMLLPIFAPFVADAGISMFVVVRIIYVMTFAFYGSYNCGAFMGTISMATHIEFPEVRKAGFAVMILNLIGFLASVPLWKAMGIIW